MLTVREPLACNPCVSVLVVNVKMRSSSSWILANLNVTGYYRVNYDPGNWGRLLAQLDSDHQVTSWVFSWTLFPPRLDAFSIWTSRFCPC